MEFRIADKFIESHARLTVDERKLVKTTAFDLQLNPASPGVCFHKLDRTKDKNFWSVRGRQRYLPDRLSDIAQDLQPGRPIAWRCGERQVTAVLLPHTA